jgi:phage shock protein B
VATLAVILLLTIVAPLFLVLHFVTKWKQTREISGDDEQLLEDLHELSQRLEDRLITLEKILGDDIPEGRKEL